MDPRVERVLAGFGQLREQLLGSPLRVDLERLEREAQGLLRELGELQEGAAGFRREDARRLELEAGRVQALFRAAAGFVLAWPVEQPYTATGELNMAMASRIQVEA
jgi:hypothetical protein